MLIRIVVGALLALAVTAVSAQTQVRGYYRKDGTYVAPHTRSNPNSTKRDNYGSSNRNSTYGSSMYDSPYARDKDRDGISNQNDSDDDNDGISDDYDSNP